MKGVRVLLKMTAEDLLELAAEAQSSMPIQSQESLKNMLTSVELFLESLKAVPK